MSGTQYVPGAVLDECRDLRRQGVPVATLAERLHIEAAVLLQLLGEPAWKPIPPTDADFDLFATDALDALL